MRYEITNTPGWTAYDSEELQPHLFAEWNPVRKKWEVEIDTLEALHKLVDAVPYALILNKHLIEAYDDDKE